MSKTLIAVDQDYLESLVKLFDAAASQYKATAEELIKESERARSLELLSPEEAAKYLKVKIKILDYYEKNGMPYYRTCHKGKWYRRGEIDEWLESGAVNRHKKGMAGA